MNFNPWNVSSIDEFSYFNCPECDFHTKDKNTFQDHATKNHPLSVVLFSKGTMVITFNSRNELNQLKNMSRDTKRKQIVSKDTKVIKFNSRNELNDLKQLSCDQKCTDIVSKYKLTNKIKVSMSTVDKSKNILNKDLTQDQKCKDILSKYKLPDKIKVSMSTIDLTPDPKCKEFLSKYNLPSKIGVSISKVDESRNTRNNNFKNRNELNQQLIKDQKSQELLLKHRLQDRIQVSMKKIDSSKGNLNGVPNIENRKALKRLSKETKYQGHIKKLQNKILKVHEKKKQDKSANKPEENNLNKNQCPICSKTFKILFCSFLI